MDSGQQSICLVVVNSSFNQKPEQAVRNLIAAPHYSRKECTGLSLAQRLTDLRAEKFCHE
jgi:hypothetical protein